VDAGRSKAAIAHDNAAKIGVGTAVQCYGHITEKETALALRDCDVVFGCTDKEAPRAILTQLSLRYLIPVFDVGVVLASRDGVIQDVAGRVTALLPGEACLFCRERISPDRIRDEMLPAEERARRIAEGYSSELPTNSPAVIPFTTTVAAMAVEELMHRLTGFKGENRHASEVLVIFDKDHVSTNRREARTGCFCNKSIIWGAGDTKRFLDMWG
jgi:molybdopterin/thiamine biosynthesis adenylyltransferase